MKSLRLPVCLALLMGCSYASRMPPIAQFNTDIDRLFPPLTLMAKESPTGGPASSAEEDDALVGFKDAFQAIGLFEEVSLRSEGKRHDFTAAIAITTRDSIEAGEVISTSLALLLLGQFPIWGSYQVEAEIDLSWRGRLLKQYKFEPLPVYWNGSILALSKDSSALVVEHLAAAFVREYQLDSPYSGKFLLDRLGASDYAHGLAFPQQALGYRHEARHIYPDPLLGVRLGYRHSLLPDSINAYIYPVKGVSWRETQATLAAELDLLRREHRLLDMQGDYLSLDMPAQATRLPVPADSGAADGMRLDFSFTDRTGEEMISQVRLFLKKDKIIKFTKTGPKGTVKQDLDEFVAAVLPALDPPGESAYMAEERLRVQKSTIFANE